MAMHGRPHLVSVIVTTHQSAPEYLTRLVSSLDRQTMPQESFEVIFVDDGSPDKTVERLRTIAKTRPNYRVRSIENTGWPSRPRNLGIHMAEGEYIAFVDHDDELGPDALRSVYEFGVANHSDVVNGKEAHTTQSSWALTTFTGDLGQTVGRTDTHPLLPMNPHKLYRREFLLEHDITFPEGRRLLWEDGVFNLRVARHAKVISTLSSVPYYHYVRVAVSASSVYEKWSPDYWFWLRNLIDEALLPGDNDLELHREQAVQHQYLGRVLRLFNDAFGRRSEEGRRFIFDEARALQSDYDLRRFDSLLQASMRTRAQLLHDGDFDLMTALARLDRPVPGQGTATAAAWVGGVLQVTATAEWARDDGATHDLTWEDDRLIAHFSEEIDAAVAPEHRDMTAELEHADLSLAVRQRDTRFAWLTDSEGKVEVEVGEGASRVHGLVAGTIDPSRAVMGTPLEPGYWDVQVRARFGGETNQRPLLSRIPASVTLHEGRLHLAYPNDGGALTLFIDGAAEAIRRLTPVAAEVAGDTVEVTLSGVHDGSGQVDTTIGLRDELWGAGEVPAVLTVEAGTASVSFARPAGRVEARIGDRAPGHPGWYALPEALGLQESTPEQRPWVGVGDLRSTILLVSSASPDNVGAQLTSEATRSLVAAALTNLGQTNEGFTTRIVHAEELVGADYLESGDESLLAEARRAVAHARAVIFCGGPALKSSSHPQRTAVLLRIAQALTTPVLFHAIDPRAFREADPKAVVLRRSLAEADIRSVTTSGRPDSTTGFFKDRAVQPTSAADPAVFCDTVFGAAKRQRQTIGLVVTRAGIFKENGVSFAQTKQRAFWCDLISAVEARGYDYRLLTVGTAPAETFLQAFADEAGIARDKVILPVNAPEDLNSAISGFAGMVAFTHEACVAAFAHRVPTVGLAITPRLKQFFTATGQGTTVLGPEGWNAEAVMVALDAAMARPVAKREAYRLTAYLPLFEGLRTVVAPDSDAEPYDYATLVGEIQGYPGTDAAALARRVEQKLVGVYESVFAVTGRAERLQRELGRHEAAASNPASLALLDQAAATGRRWGGRVLRGIRSRVGRG